MKSLLKSKSFPSALFVAGAGAALACGPFFPSSIIRERLATLRAAPHNSFAFEASHLAPRGPFKPLDDKYWSDDERIAAQDKAEKAGLTAQQAADIAAMRASPDGDAAMTKAGSLPRGIALYTAGAADFHAGKYEAARAWFAAVLALPLDQARPRLLWAAYSLARADAALGDTARAAQEFAAVRTLARKGAPDDFGFAVASLGEEARHREPRAAVALYAQQAAYDSDSGVQSLRLTAAAILADPARLKALVADPLVQKLVVGYTLARLSGVPYQFELEDGQAKSQLVAEPSGTPTWMSRDTATLLDRVIGALGKIDSPAGADRLAALAYRGGRFDLAAGMANKSDAPLAHWVKAKLALRAGNLAAAQTQYAAAVRAIPSGALEKDNVALLLSEQGVTALARDQYVEALRILYAAPGHWTDAAYVAERVLTTDELKTFVDAQGVPAKPQCAADLWDGQASLSTLRDLLARRLMRDGRRDEALAYYCKQETRAIARTYAADVQAGASGWDKVGRARRLFGAAQAARRNGMEIMGAELEPDYTVYDGMFDVGALLPDPGTADSKIVTPGERARAKASAPVPGRRFHYRYVAADEAEAAANLLSPRTQAYAAVLCSASGWMLDAPDGAKRGWAIYQRYVRTGPHQEWASHFGRKCPAPDFGSATFFSRNWKAVERRFRAWRRSR